ncbi:unnamed protein product [Dimorphilus gyrociliatus]|uniref:Uncharacterized protein n=1 Tax=Dimorphilus gyrociliatus TaxID=2664684 RepID=A0A7I8W781_9ANNE|nr:unnamed protein product [Dimorphilus gyrociliatus]
MKMSREQNIYNHHFNSEDTLYKPDLGAVSHKKESAIFQTRFSNFHLTDSRSKLILDENEESVTEESTKNGFHEHEVTTRAFSENGKSSQTPKLPEKKVMDPSIKSSQFLDKRDKPIVRDDKIRRSSSSEAAVVETQRAFDFLLEYGEQ